MTVMYVVLALVGVAIAVLSILGEWTWALAVGVGALLGWGLLTPTRRTYTIFAIAFFVPVTVTYPFTHYDSLTVIAVLAAIGLGAQLLDVRRQGWNARVLAVAMVVPAAIVVAALFEWRGVKPLVVSVAPWVCYGVLAWRIVVYARQDPAGMRRLATVFSWTGVGVAAIAVVQRWILRWPVLDDLATDPGFQSFPNPLRSAGVMGHPLVYGTFAMGMALIALGLRFRGWRYAYIANMIGLVLSGTRSAWVAALCALALWYIAQPRKLSLRGTVTALASAAGAYAIWKIGPPIVAQTISVAANRVDHVTQSESATARYERSGTAMSHITDNVSAIIFGHGPEGHVLFLRTVGIPDGLAQTFDNSYLTLWYDSGIVGAAAFVVVAAMLLLGYRSLTGRMILGAFVAQILFFDFFLWPCAAGVALLGLGILVAGAPEGQLQPLDRGTLRIWGYATVGDGLSAPGRHRRDTSRPGLFGGQPTGPAPAPDGPRHSAGAGATEQLSPVSADRENG